MAEPVESAKPSAAMNGGAPSGRTIDNIDRKIIETLQANGREPLSRVAEEAGVTEATARARYERLVADHVLQVVGITNPLDLGFEGTAMVGIRVAGVSDPVAGEIAEWAEVSYVVVTAGTFDILAEIVADDITHYREILGRIRAVPAVTSTETFAYLELQKQTFDWGARASADLGQP